MAVKLLQECRKCDAFGGMAYGSLVICTQLGDKHALVISQPSNENPNFLNGTMIVLCTKD
jgi:hypothetical protein